MKTVVLLTMLAVAVVSGFSQEAPADSPTDQAREELLQELKTLVERKDGLTSNEKLRIALLTARLYTEYGEHMVRYGDTLARIAMGYNTTVREIQRLNPDPKDPRRLHVGQILNVKEVENQSVDPTPVTAPRSSESQSLN